MFIHKLSSNSRFRLTIRVLAIALLLAVAAPLILGWTVARADDDLQEWQGVITTMPADKLGDWVIGGQTFTANTDTEFDEEDGLLAQDGCAKVEYEETGDGTLLAHEIDSEPASDCGSDGSGDGNGSGDDGGDGNGGGDDGGDGNGNGNEGGNGGGDLNQKHYGVVEEMPGNGHDGDWVVGGVRFRATTNTEFDPEHGAFQLGACVKVESEAATPRVAKEMETEHQYRCSGDGTEPPKAEMYGVVNEVPAGLLGRWRIGGMEFVADEDTEFDQEDGEFASGATVKVKFYTDADDVNHALEIETKYGKEDDDAGKDDHNRHRHRHQHRYGEEGHVFGVIDILPQTPSLYGDWTVSGVVYTVDETTELEDDVADYTVGTRVKVEYYLDESGARIAEEIDVTGDNGNVKDDNHSKLLGFVNEMPASGFIGTWMIAGAEFMVNGNSELEENHGLFGEGAYVEVEYSIIGNHRIVHEMETQVPPGAGDDTSIGAIDSMDDSMDDSAQAASIQAMNTGEWSIGSKTYAVIPATQLDDDGGELTVGSTAIVNSYVASDGRAVATSISAIVLDEQVLLPFTIR